jgi:hypothetical protein
VQTGVGLTIWELVLRVALGRTYLRELRCPVPLGMARMCTSVMTARVKALKFCPCGFSAYMLPRWSAGALALAHVHAHASTCAPTQNARHELYKEDKCSNDHTPVTKPCLTVAGEATVRRRRSRILHEATWCFPRRHKGAAVTA